MSAGVIVSLKAGAAFPTPLLHKILEHHHSSMSFVSREGEMVSTDFINLTKDLLVEKNINTYLEMWNEEPCSFYFRQNDTPLTEADQQPFDILWDGSGEYPLLSLLLEGTFPGYVRPGLTNEFVAVDEFLGETIKGLYTRAGKDLKKTMELAAGPDFRTVMEGFLAPSGAALLIPGKGEPLLFARRTMGEGLPGAHFDWGFTTKTYGYTETKVGATTVVTGSQPTQTLTKQQRIEVARKAAGAAAGVPPANLTMPKEPEMATASVPSVGLEGEYTLPKDIQGKQREAYIVRNLQKPFQFMDGWEGNLVYKEHMFQPNSTGLQGLKAIKQRTVGKSFTEAEAALKEVAKERKEPMIVEGYTGQMGAKSKEHMTQLYKTDPGFVVSVTKIQDTEKPYDPYTKQILINEDIPLFWGPEKFRLTAEKNPHAAASLLQEFSMRILAFDPKIRARMKDLIEKADKAAAATTAAPAPAATLTKQQRIEAARAAAAKAAA